MVLQLRIKRKKNGLYGLHHKKTNKPNITNGSCYPIQQSLCFHALSHHFQQLGPDESDLVWIFL